MTNNAATLGLKADEIVWLRRNCTTNKTAAILVNLYQAIKDKPTDTLSRTQFKHELERWRQRVENGEPVP